MNLRITSVCGTGVSQQNGMPPGGGYRYRGDPSWNPAKNLPVKPDRVGNLSHEGRQARLARFTELREARMSVEDAGREVGVGTETARVYEKEHRAGGAS